MVRHELVRFSQIEARVAGRSRARPRADVPPGLGHYSGSLHAACVYFVADPSTGLIKIGTTESLPRRVRQIELERGVSLRLLLAARGDMRTEHALHRLFADERVEGEWFRPSERLLRYIADVRTYREALPPPRRSFVRGRFAGHTSSDFGLSTGAA